MRRLRALKASPRTSILVVAILTAAVLPLAAQQRPSRDATQARRATGTACISGHVVSAETGRPLARARVTVLLQTARDQSENAADGGGPPISTLTDPSGAFSVAGLPAGAYTLSASKTAYLTLAHGAQRPQRPGKPITVRQGEQVLDIDIRLPRGSVLTGRVYDDMGEPIVRATVQALRHQYLQGEPRLVGSGSAQTDDRGQFRIFGLTPGNYVVTAAARMDAPPAERGRPGDASLAQSYAPTYYPGVMNAADAITVPLGLQQEYSNVDFMLQAVPTARVSGAIVGDQGAVAGAMLILVTDDPRGVSANTTYSARVQEDGTFVVNGVPPGRYLAIARSTMGPGARRGSPGTGVQRPAQVGIQPVSVAGQDVTGVTVHLSAGGTIAGWVTFESAGNQRGDFNQLRLSTMPPVSLPFVGSETARVQADGSFTISNVVAGSHLLRLNSPPQGWALKGIFLTGRDVSDQLIEVRNGQTTGGLQVVLTDRITTVAVDVVDAKSEAVTDCYVVLFATDPSTWRPRSRTISGSRPDSAGKYTFTGIPAGDYYIAVLPDAEPGSWYDPVLLDALSKTATRVSVEEGDTKAVTLKYGPSPSTED